MQIRSYRIATGKEMYKERRRVMKKRSLHREVSLVIGLVLLLSVPTPALSLYGNKGAEKEDAEGKPTSVKLQDFILADQDGRKVKFARDVIGDRIVVIDTFYTTCGQICPILSAIFMGLQDLLGNRQGKDVVLVSLTVDPVTDIPPRLKEYADSWNARPGWVFLTGEKRRVDEVLEGLGLYAADYTAHPAMILVGDGLSDKWTRYYGFASPEQIMERIEELSAERQVKARSSKKGEE
jgi:protein SCO1/2